MAKFLFNIKHKQEIELLMGRLGLSKEEAREFLFENYNENVTFKEYFKKYVEQWLPNGENEEGKLKVIYTFKFPRRMINLSLTAGNKDFNWKQFVS